MEIYILKPAVRQKVFALLDNFSEILLVAEQLQASLTPTGFWFSRFAGG